LLAEPGIAEVVTRGDLEAGRAPPGSKFFVQAQRMFDRERIADLQVVTKPYWLVSGSGRKVGTSHGSPYPYDSNVPILLYGPAWIAAERVDTARRGREHRAHARGDPLASRRPHPPRDERCLGTCPEANERTRPRSG